MASATGQTMLYQGASGNTSQTDDSAAMGGDPPTSAQLTDSTSNLLFDSTPSNPAGGGNIVHNNVFYFRCPVGSSTLGLFSIYNGLIASSGTGVLTFTLTNAADAGLQVLLVATVGGVFPSSPEKTVMAYPTATSITAPDTGGLWRLECLDAMTGLTPTCPQGDIIVSQGGQILGAIRAAICDHNGTPPTTDLGPTQAMQEYSAAVATSSNSGLSSANRLTAPGGIGSFSIPLLIQSPYAGSNGPLTMPDMVSTDNGGAGTFTGIALQKTLVAGIPNPIGGPQLPVWNFQFAGGM